MRQGIVAGDRTRARHKLCRTNHRFSGLDFEQKIYTMDVLVGVTKLAVTEGSDSELQG